MCVIKMHYCGAAIVLCYFVTFNDTLFYDVTPHHTHGYICYIRECGCAAILGPGFYTTFLNSTKN